MSAYVEESTCDGESKSGVGNLLVNPSMRAHQPKQLDIPLADLHSNLLLKATNFGNEGPSCCLQLDSHVPSISVKVACKSVDIAL